MKHRDALRIASTKFRTRKIRTAFLVLSLAVGLTMIAALAGGVAGVMKTARAIFLDAGQGRYYAVEVTTLNRSENTVVEAKKPSIDVGSYIQERKEQYSQKDISVQQVQMIMDNSLKQTLTELPELTTMSGLLSFQTSDAQFIQSYIIDPTIQWDTPQDSIVPVLVPTAALIGDGGPDWYNKSAKEQYTFLQEQQKKYLGKIVQYHSIKAKSESNTTTTEVTGKTQYKIVGFAPEDLYASNLYQSGTFIVPNWAAKNIPEVQGLFEQGNYRTLIAFANKKDRNDFIAAKQGQQVQEVEKRTDAASGETLEFSHYFMPAQGRFDAFSEIASQFQKFFFGVAGFLLAIGEIMLLLTVGRVVADSRKEIGVYRAIGASRSDVRKIFFWYVCVLTAAATFIAVVLAITGQIIASVKWGEQLFYGLVQFSGNAAVVAQPKYLFLGTNGLHILALFGFAFVSALVASAIPIFRASRIDPIIALKEE